MWPVGLEQHQKMAAPHLNLILGFSLVRRHKREAPLIMKTEGGLLYPFISLWFHPSKYFLHPFPPTLSSWSLFCCIPRPVRANGITDNRGRLPSKTQSPLLFCVFFFFFTSTGRLVWPMSCLPPSASGQRQFAEEGICLTGAPSRHLGYTHGFRNNQ